MALRVWSTLAGQKHGQTLKWVVDLVRHLMGTFSRGFCHSDLSSLQVQILLTKRGDSILRSAHKRRFAESVSLSGSPALAPDAIAPKPEEPSTTGTNAALD
jgi:hypothetical protein